jgi:MFS family permease
MSSRTEPAAGPGIVGPAAMLAIAMMGDALIYAVLPVHADAFGVSLFWVGVLLAANRLVRIFGNGWIVEMGRRLGARPVCLIGATLAIVSTAALAFAPEAWSLLAARIAWGIAFAALNLMSFAYAAAVPSHAGRRLGAIRATIGVVLSLTLTVGAWLTGVLGPRDVFWLLALLTVPALLLAVRLPELSLENQRRRGLVLPMPSRIDLWAFAQGFAVDGVFLVTLALLLKDELRGMEPVLAAGLVLATRWVVEIVTAPAAGALADRFGAARLVALLTLGAAAGFAAIGFGLVYPGAFLVTIVRGLTNTLGAAMVAERNPGNAVGAQSAYATWRDIGAAAGPLAAGVLASLAREPQYGGLALWMLATVPLLLGLRPVRSA